MHILKRGFFAAISAVKKAILEIIYLGMQKIKQAI